MKAPKLALAAAVAAALVLSGCASGQDDDKDSDAKGGGDNKDIKICMYTHGDGGGFWSVAKKGAEQAAEDLGVTLDYQESNNDPQAQAQFIEAGVDSGCDGTHPDLAVVLIGVHDDRAVPERVRVSDAKVGAFRRDLQTPLAIRADVDVAEVAEVPRLVRRERVRMAVGGEVVARALCVRRAAVALLVHVDAVLAR